MAKRGTRLMQTKTPVAIENVSDTAFWIAHYRGAEAGRPKPLFLDPLAALLAGERGRSIATAMPGTEMTAWSTVVRTRIIDDYILESIAQGADTILNLGAGLDTRPYRLDLPPAIKWYEADHSSIIAYKDDCLRDEVPRCRLQRLSVDLADPAARRSLLESVGADARRALVVTEGVLPYLSEDEVAALATELRSQPSFQAWIVDYFSPITAKFRQKRMKQAKMGAAPHKFMPADWYGFFKAQGWAVAEKRFLADLGKILGRPMPAGISMRLSALLLGALSRLRGGDSWNEFYGYFLLKPA
jgi:methyltransferase (TIGR00027 family)